MVVSKINKQRKSLSLQNLLFLFSKSMSKAAGSGMVGGVLPLGQINSGEYTGLAGNPRVDLMIRQHHSIHLK